MEAVALVVLQTIRLLAEVLSLAFYAGFTWGKQQQPCKQKDPTPLMKRLAREQIDLFWKLQCGSKCRTWLHLTLCLSGKVFMQWFISFKEQTVLSYYDHPKWFFFQKRIVLVSLCSYSSREKILERGPCPILPKKKKKQNKNPTVPSHLACNWQFKRWWKEKEILQIHSSWCTVLVIFEELLLEEWVWSICV